MKINNSFPDTDNLILLLNDSYDVVIKSLFLYRRNVGTVYYAQTDTRCYVFKLYRHFDTLAALQAANVVTYLKDNGFPTLRILKTKQNAHHIKVDMPEGVRIGLLYEYIDGVMPCKEESLEEIGLLTGRLHRLMKDYEGSLIELGKGHYVDRFLGILDACGFDKAKLENLKYYGDELWGHLSKLPSGFVHGDLHTGNMFRLDDGRIFLIDFDIVSDGFPMLDAATFCDGTNYNAITQEGIDSTLRNFDQFFKGYSQILEFSDEETAAIMDWIIVRHFELNGTIPYYKFPVDGNFWFDERCMESCYNWIIKARDMMI